MPPGLAGGGSAGEGKGQNKEGLSGTCFIPFTPEPSCNDPQIKHLEKHEAYADSNKNSASNFNHHLPVILVVTSCERKEKGKCHGDQEVVSIQNTPTISSPSNEGQQSRIGCQQGRDCDFPKAWPNPEKQHDSHPKIYVADKNVAQGR